MGVSGMKVFISYSRHDEGAVRALVGDLQRARVQVWLDEDLGGGESWWRDILGQILTCEVFIVALSDHSLDSKPCQAELRYAQDLNWADPSCSDRPSKQPPGQPARLCAAGRLPKSDLRRQH